MTEPPNIAPAPSITSALIAWWGVGALLRVTFIVLEPATPPVADETMWLMALNRIPAAHFSPFANYPIFHPPLYPYFLAAINTVFGSLMAIKIVQALIGSLLIPAVFRISSRIFGGRAAIWAAGFAAGYPELVWYSAHFWCETLFLAILWWALERTLAADETGSFRAAAGAGLLFGLAVLTRETVLYLVPLAALWLILAKPRRRPRLGLAVLLAALAAIAPWTARNWVQFGAFIPVSTGGGLNLYQGNAPLSRSEVYVEYYANEGKVDQYRWAMTAGLRAIAARQPRWVFEKIREEGPKLAELDSLALIHLRRRAYGEPTCRVYQGATAVIIIPWILTALLALVAATRVRANRHTLFVLGLLGAYLFLHIATHGFSRYRLPVVPGFLILGASLAESSAGGTSTPGRGWVLGALSVLLALLWAPSALDQLGHLGFVSPPSYEGFAPVC